MTFDWFDAWPFLALMALLLATSMWLPLREWWSRRAARRRARALCAPAPDLTGCIQRAGLNAEAQRVQRSAKHSTPRASASSAALR